MTKGEESEPALTSINFSFLLRLSEVKYHWSKSGKGDKTVNLLSHSCGLRVEVKKLQRSGQAHFLAVPKGSLRF